MIYELFNPQQAKILMDRIWPEVKANLMAGHKMRIEIKKAHAAWTKAPNSTP